MAAKSEVAALYRPEIRKIAGGKERKSLGVSHFVETLFWLLALFSQRQYKLIELGKRPWHSTWH